MLQIEIDRRPTQCRWHTPMHDRRHATRLTAYTVYLSLNVYNELVPFSSFILFEPMLPSRTCYLPVKCRKSQLNGLQR